MAKKRGTESVEGRIAKLEIKIKKLEREKRKLLSENKALQNALKNAEEYTISSLKGKDIDHIVGEIEATKLKKECPNCGNIQMYKVNYGEFYIESCNYKGCGYRNRIHEKRSSKA